MDPTSTNGFKAPRRNGSRRLNGTLLTNGLQFIGFANWWHSSGPITVLHHSDDSAGCGWEKSSTSVTDGLRFCVTLYFSYAPRIDEVLPPQTSTNPPQLLQLFEMMVRVMFSSELQRINVFHLTFAEALLNIIITKVFKFISSSELRILWWNVPRT